MRRATGILAALVALAVPGTAAAHEPWVTEFNDGLLVNVGAWDITSAKDGNLWFTESLGTFGRITPSAVLTDFPGSLLGGGQRGIAATPDGNLWFAESGGDGAIARATPNGDVTEFSAGLTPGDPWDVAAGPDGNVWFVNRSPAVIGRITPEGVITEFTDGLSTLSEPSSITAGPDGNLWFTESASGRIGRITTAGVITEFTSGLSGSGEPTDIAAGPDGALWFTLNADPGGIGRITKAGVVTTFTAGITPNSAPTGIAKGPDGALWFTESAGPGRIGRITTAGDVTEYTGGLTSGMAPWLIAAGPDGNMWFTENALLGRVARITLPPILKGLAADRLATSSARLRATVRPNSQATDYHFEWGKTGAYANSTPASYLGNGYDPETVTALLAGLEPATEYHFRVVATNDSGTSHGPDRVFRTLALPLAEPAVVEPEPAPEPAPDFGKTVVAEPEGSVRVKAPGGDWETLAPGAELPVGASFDTRRGSVELTSAMCGGARQTGRFGGGLFLLRQPRAACGRVDVYLRGGNFRACGRAARRSAGSSAVASRARRVRRLWGRDNGGRFRTHGRHSHATVRGTRWFTIDRCDGTLTRVTQGAVVVRDLVRRRSVVVRAGRSYLAKRRALRHRRR